MTNKEKVKCYREKTIEELEKILSDPNATESDIIIASFEKADKEDALGISKYYTTEEVREKIFGRSCLARRCN